MVSSDSSSWANRALATMAMAYLVISADAMVLPRSSTPIKGALQVPFTAERSAVSEVSQSVSKAVSRIKGAGDLTVPLGNRLVNYNVEIGLGTLPQPFNLTIDTGSSDLWVSSDTNPDCEKINCARNGSFKKKASSTYKYKNSEFSTQYQDYTYAKGDWGVDDVTIAGTKITGFTFGLASEANSSLSVLGIGYAGLESSEGLGISPSSFEYDNLPILLSKQGVINTPAYSLWLNGIDSAEGNILFGAVDHAKYKGELVLFDTEKDFIFESSQTQFLISLQELDLKKGSSSNKVLSSSSQVLLDSGTSFTYLPKDTADEIIKLLSGTYNSEAKGYITDCSQTGSLEYNFGKTTISVPFFNILLPLYEGSSKCFISVLETPAEVSILGDNFLRSAYVVYDLKNNKIGLVPTTIDATDSKIEVITDNIPTK